MGVVVSGAFGVEAEDEAGAEVEEVCACLTWRITINNTYKTKKLLIN